MIPKEISTSVKQEVADALNTFIDVIRSSDRKSNESVATEVSAFIDTVKSLEKRERISLSK